MQTTTPVEGAISSGNQGGLESNGSLAEKIAKRNFKGKMTRYFQNPNPPMNTASDFKT
jgi:hypothetical protein